MLNQSHTAHRQVIRPSIGIPIHIVLHAKPCSGLHVIQPVDLCGTLSDHFLHLIVVVVHGFVVVVGADLAVAGDCQDEAAAVEVAGEKPVQLGAA